MDTTILPPRRRKIKLTPILTVTVLAALSLLMVFPFVWMVSTSLKTPATAFLLPPQLWPSEWRWENYRQVLFHPTVPILLFFANSIKIAGLITLGQLVTCTLAAYAFARLNFPGRDVLFIVLLTALMVPAQITIIPVFIEMRAEPDRHALGADPAVDHQHFRCLSAAPVLHDDPP